MGAREERPDLAKKATRPPTPSSGPGRKRFRFNSESGQCLLHRGFVEEAFPERVLLYPKAFEEGTRPVSQEPGMGWTD